MERRRPVLCAALLIAVMRIASARDSHCEATRSSVLSPTSAADPAPSLPGTITIAALPDAQYYTLCRAPHLGDARRIIDVGTGGGFPGIPLAVAFPDRHFTLIDGTQKKIRFVAESIAALDIRNATAIAARSESYGGERNFDVVVARAVGSLADLVRDASGLLGPRGRLLAMKGKLADEELRAVPRGWRTEAIALRVPGLDAERHLVTLSRRSA